MTMISPTPGRVVWFHPHPSDPIYTAEDAAPLAATVAYVHNDRLINIGVLDHRGVHHSRLKVTLVQDGDTPPEGQWKTPANHCVWMPYQRGQAAKTEALEAKSAEVPAGAPTVSTADHSAAEGQSDDDAELARMIAEEEAAKSKPKKGK